jgi:tetratricopeptide (TPR) repeat protein
MKDIHGHALSGASSASLGAYQTALDEFRCFVGDPLASAEAALAASPDMTMAHVLKAWLYLLGTEPAGVTAARQACAAAELLPANDHERRHLHAATLMASGRLHDAARALEDLNLLYPHDVLALQAGHQLDFFTGDSRMLRDRMLRVAPAWHAGMPGYHALLSMQAFGLEETGDYARAEAYGRQSVELEPRDGWDWHAVAHVYEMKNQPEKGIAWLGQNTQTWAEGSFFAVHNWWHLALFNLRMGREEEVMRLYDEAIGKSDSFLVLELIDQSALLWRLHLRGVDAGHRWSALADRWKATHEAGFYAFNDVHAMMAFVGSGRASEQAALLEAMREAMSQTQDNGGFTREVGYATASAIQAFGQRDYAQSVDLLRSVRNRSHRFGGSHAQRDAIDLTLIRAAERSDNRRLAEALANERAQMRQRAAPLLAEA